MSGNFGRAGDKPVEDIVIVKSGELEFDAEAFEADSKEEL